MSERTTETTVTFKHPFMLDAFDVMQPAGTYRLVIDEEVPECSSVSRSWQAFPVAAAELNAALEADARDLPPGSSRR